MNHGTRKPRKLKVRQYAVHAKESDNIGEKELNTIIFNSMKNGQSKQFYTHGFDCENITKTKLLIFLKAWKLRRRFMKVL